MSTNLMCTLGKKKGYSYQMRRTAQATCRERRITYIVDNLYTSEEEKYGCSMPFSGNSIHEVKGGDGVGMMSLVPRLT